MKQKRRTEFRRTKSQRTRFQRTRFQRTKLQRTGVQRTKHQRTKPQRTEFQGDQRDLFVGKQLDKKFRIVCFVFAVLFLSVLGTVGVTYAWKSISQNVVNEFLAEPDDVAVELLKFEKWKDGTLTETKISGAKFYLYKEDGTRIGGIYTTDEQGRIALRLEPGNYYFTEIAAKEGYTFDVDADGNPKNTYPFTVKGEEELVTVRVYNIRNTGTLTVEKQVQNADGSALREEQYAQSFVFKVIFSDGGTYSYRVGDRELQSVASGGTIALKHGEQAVFENIPVGVTYTITEEPVEHYWGKTEGHRGTVTASGNTAIFTNIYAEQVEKVPAKIYVTKVVEGPVPDTDKSYDMNLTINGVQQDFSLKNGETAEFDAWVGDQYEVTEKDYADEGYYQQISNGFGNVLGDTNVTVTNIYQREIMKKISVEKEWQLNGASEDVIPDFIIVQLKQGNTVVDEKKITPDENGVWKAVFEAPKYDEEGNEIHYTIEEDPISGFYTEYDASRIEDGIVFIVNRHKAPIQVYLPVLEKKVLGTNAPLTRFEFWLCGKDHTPMPDGTVGQTKIVSIDQSGQIDLGSVWFTNAGEYHYTLTEIDEGKEGWTYDRSEYELVITVYEQDGHLQAYFNIYKDGIWIDHILFQNTYEDPENPEKPKDDPENPKDDPENPKDDPENPKDDPENPKDDSESPKDDQNKAEGDLSGSGEENGAGSGSISAEDSSTGIAAGTSGGVIQTGDQTKIVRYLILALLSLGVIVKLAIRREKARSYFE